MWNYFWTDRFQDLALGEKFFCSYVPLNLSTKIRYFKHWRIFPTTKLATRVLSLVLLCFKFSLITFPMRSALKLVSMLKAQPFTPVSIESDQSVKIKLASDVKNDIQSVLNWGKKWLMNFNAPKPKLLSIKHMGYLFLTSISIISKRMTYCTLLGFTFSADMKW